MMPMGPITFRMAGLEPTPRTERRFRKFVAALIEKPLASPDIVDQDRAP
jgi:hypothetical protein